MRGRLVAVTRFLAGFLVFWFWAFGSGLEFRRALLRGAGAKGPSACRKGAFLVPVLLRDQRGGLSGSECVVLWADGCEPVGLG